LCEGEGRRPIDFGRLLDRPLPYASAPRDPSHLLAVTKLIPPPPIFQDQPSNLRKCTAPPGRILNRPPPRSDCQGERASLVIVVPIVVVVVAMIAVPIVPVIVPIVPVIVSIMPVIAPCVVRRVFG
jgi:hypothetical protein